MEAGFNARSYISLKSSSHTPPAWLDIFVFRDGAVKSLDSYSKLYSDGSQASVVSGRGDRIVAMIGGARLKADQIASVRCYEDLESLYVSLEDEVDDSPVLSGETVICAGKQGHWNIVLEPLMSMVEVLGLSVKLKGEYAGKSLDNVQAYLTNVNGSCQPLRRDGFRPTEIINNGRLRDSDLERMSSPQLVRLGPKVSRQMGGETTYETFNLYCYPNDVVEESSGSPFTRLVIQGDIDGQTYYYPVPVNRPGFGYSSGKAGICRNVKYVMNIHITGPGSASPADDIHGTHLITQGSATFHPGDFIRGNVGDIVHVWCDVYPPDTPVEWDWELIDGDVQRGIYQYVPDPDGNGLMLTLTGRGTGMVYVEVKGIVDEAFLCVIVVQ